MTDASREHAPALDGLRGVAVLLVVAHHWLGSEHVGFDLGLTGVRLFFVLSGFLITSILLGGRELMAHGESTLGHLARSFYARRFLRIVPIYYLTLAVLWALNVAGVRDEIGWHVTYMTSLLVARTDHWIGLTSHFWSLSVEEHFYLFWPWIVLSVPTRWLRATFIALIVAGPLWRSIGLLAGLGKFALLYVLPGCLDALGVGALLALVHRESPQRANRAGLAMLGVGAAVLAVATLATRGAGATATSHLIGAQRGLAWALLLGAAVSACVRRDGMIVRAMSVAPLRGVGRVSYAVYIVHPMVPKALAALGLEPRVFAARFALWSIVTAAISVASWRWFEGPINARKSRFPYRDATRAQSLQR